MKAQHNSNSNKQFSLPEMQAILEYFVYAAEASSQQTPNYQQVIGYKLNPCLVQVGATLTYYPSQNTQFLNKLVNSIANYINQETANLPHQGKAPQDPAH